MSPLEQFLIQRGIFYTSLYLKNALTDSWNPLEIQAACCKSAQNQEIIPLRIPNQPHPIFTIVLPKNLCQVILFRTAFWALYCTPVSCCTVLYCVVLCCTVLCCVVLCCTVLYCVVLCCTVSYCALLRFTVLYCALLCYTVLYCAVGVVST